MKPSYFVVLRATANQGGLKGLTIYKSFASSGAFDKWYKGDMEAEYDLVAKGVTEKRAKELSDGDIPVKTGDVFKMFRPIMIGGVSVNS